MRLLLFWLMLALPAMAAAQTLLVSPAPDSVAIAIYRAPNRAPGQPINRRYPQGYALITETRTVDLPRGEARLRFEGVSEGMHPESAIISGLPQGVIEKNRDARLLSPAGLVDAYLRRRVQLQRTNPATGETRTQDAILRTGSQGGVLIETEAGIEALRCSGLPERIVFDAVPADLSPRPSLSVLTYSDRPVRATLQLTYLAEGFDWDANYIVETQAAGQGDSAGAVADGGIAEGGTADGSTADGPKLSLFAWLTVANGGDQRFPEAQLLAVAGKPNKARAGRFQSATAQPLRLECYPDDTTSDLPLRTFYGAPPPTPPPPMMAMAPEQIMVTGARLQSAVPVAAIQATQENLGDLKLYRVPEPISVAAKAQKQVAMIVQPRVAYRTLYSGGFTANDLCCGDGAARPLRLMLRANNLSSDGLGLPLPQGQVALYEPSAYGPLLIGQTRLGDKAVGQKVELGLGPRADVHAQISMPEAKQPRRFAVRLSNALDRPVDVEFAVPFELRRGPGFTKMDGVPTWKGSIPAHGEQRLTFDIRKDGD